MKKIYLLFFLSAFSFGVFAQSSYWETSGNSATTFRHFLGTTDNNPLVFRTRNVERMHLLSGKSFLGIGTSDPHATLHLHFQLDIPNALTPSRVLQLTTPATGNTPHNGFSAFFNNTKDLFFKQQEQAKFFIEGPAGGLMIAPDGSIGIGTELPIRKLHIEEGSLFISKTANNAPNPFPLNTFLELRIIENMYNGIWTLDYHIDGVKSKGLHLYYRHLAGAPVTYSQLFLRDNGFVGIKNTQPASELDVGGTVTALNAMISKELIASKLTTDSATITGDTYIYGNIGIGTMNPKQKLHIVNGNIVISKTSAKAPNSENGAIMFGADVNDGVPSGKWGIEYLSSDHPEYGGYGLNFWRPWNPAGGGWANYALFLHDSGNVGIGKREPQAKLDVNGSFKAQSANFFGNLSVKENVFNLSLGSAYTSNLGWGTSYIGFNATRDNGNWTLNGDGANNGGAVIWASVGGDIFFASIPKSSANSGSAQTIQDVEVKGNIKLQLTHAGVLKAKEVQVTLANWPDYVFNEDYKLLPLSAVEQYIKENSRLPEIPSAQEVEENGVELGNMQKKLLLKVEELTLYILDLQKQIDELKKQ
jgi:hypothetical protein